MINKEAVTIIPKLRQILFSTSMVQALLEGRKTQTRRIIKRIPENTIQMSFDKERNIWYSWQPGLTESFPENCDYGKVGDVLWVRERFFKTSSEFETTCHYSHYADFISMSDQLDKDDFKWKPSIHMPKEACRLWLEITDIRAERLQNISNKDAIAEGIEFDDISIRYYDYIKECWWEYMLESANDLDSEQKNGIVPFPFQPVHSYETLWKTINGEFSWCSNPWVWVLEFKQIEKPLNFLNNGK